MGESIRITPCPYPFCRSVVITRLSTEVELMDEYDRRQVERRAAISASIALEKEHDRGKHKKQRSKENDQL